MTDVADQVYGSLRVVLVEPSHPGNIGAAARAMKTMGLSNLWLVSPKRFPDAEATARASGADDLLYRARVVESYGQALDGCGLVVGASARRRTVSWPQLDPRHCARQVVAAASKLPVALVFGREHSGLTNAELERCHYLVQIPANPAYSSLNLAAAVQILAYEIRMAVVTSGGAEVDRPERLELATTGEMQGVMGHLEQVLSEIGFLNPAQPRQLMRRLRRLFNRAQLDKTEVNILRGILTAVQRTARSRDGL